VTSSIFHLPNQSSSTSFHPLHVVLSYSHLSTSHRHYLLSLSTTIELTSYKQALLHPSWVHAMNAEIEALEQNKTWPLVDIPPNIKPIGCIWVYKLKHRSDGSVERHKVRLVAKGFSQIEGLDYF